MNFVCMCPCGTHCVAQLATRQTTTEALTINPLYPTNHHTNSFRSNLIKCNRRGLHMPSSIHSTVLPGIRDYFVTLVDSKMSGDRKGIIDVDKTQHSFSSNDEIDEIRQCFLQVECPGDMLSGCRHRNPYATKRSNELCLHKLLLF